jgi:hypothetical protein
MIKKNILFAFFCFLSVLLIGGCQGEKEESSSRKKISATVTQQRPSKAGGVKKATVPSSQLHNPPQIKSAQILPAPAFADSDLRVKVEPDDPEGYLINYKYQWVIVKEGKSIKDAEELQEEVNPTLSHGKFVRGDALAVDITPSNWFGEGKPFQTAFYIIQNSPPEIVSSPPATFSDTRLTYEVKVKDPDLDAVTFTLGEGAPQGMTIDPATGLIVWPIPPKASGNYQIVVKGDDGHKGTCFQRFNLTVTPGKPKQQG